MDRSTSANPCCNQSLPESSESTVESIVTLRETCTNTIEQNCINDVLNKTQTNLSPSPKSSDDQAPHELKQSAENDSELTVTSREIYTNTNTVDLKSMNNMEIISLSPESPQTFELDRSQQSYFNTENLINTAVNTSIPLILINQAPSAVVQQPLRSPRFNSDLPSPASVIAGQPQTLFVQALAKLNESSLSMAVMNHFRMTQLTTPNTSGVVSMRKTELSPPDSLTSAPPSYSFVLRQMAVRRRPRIVGTFIPSPSFVQHTPPPNYAAAFDVYVENPIPPPPRVYNFGFASMPVVCPGCGYTGMSLVHSKITICTHLCAVVLCILCCWVCAPLPYILRSCKDVYHYCRNCRTFLGMYCPTNPENTFN